MLLGVRAKRTCHLMNLRDGKTNILPAVHSGIKRSQRCLPAVQYLVGGIDGIVKGVFVFHFAVCNVKSVSGEAGMRRNLVGAANDSHRTLLPGLEITGIQFV